MNHAEPWRGVFRSRLAQLALWAVALLAACSLGGCASNEAAASPMPGDELVADPFPTTLTLTADELASLDPDAGDGKLHFRSAPRILDGVGVGSVLVAPASASAPRGLLRAVLAVDRSGQELTLQTAQAPIQVAFRKLHVRFTRSAAVAQPASAASLLPSVSLGSGSFEDKLPFSYVLFDGDGDPGTTNDQIVTSGSIGGGFDFDLTLDVDWGGVDALPDAVSACVESFTGLLTGHLPDCSIDALLPEAKVSFVVHPKVNADAKVQGAAILEYDKEVDLASTTLPPVVLGPLVFVPVVDLTAELKGGASAAFTTGVHGSAVFETSVVVSSKQSSNAQLSPPKLQNTDFGPDETQVTLHADAKVGVGARLNILLYGVTGPYATARAYGSIQADLLNEPCWSLHAGIDADLGIKVTSPALPFLGHITLVDWKAATMTPLDVQIASGSCLAPKDASDLPPGSGPDASHFAQPTFEPWSRSLSSPADGALAGSPGNATVYSDLQRTIDGRYVRAGYGVRTLTKMSDDGGLVWARDLQFDGARLSPLRTRPSQSGEMVVASSAVTAPIVVTTLRQDGTVEEARAFGIPLDECSTEVTSLTPDGAGGSYVAGSCVGSAAGFLLHATPQDASLHLIDAGHLASFRVRVAEAIQGDAFLAGALNDGTDGMFALRISPQGAVVYAKRYHACPEASDAIPSAAIVGSKGEVTIAGSGGAQHNGIVVRLRPDGSVGFASFPGFGFGAGSVFLLDSIAELPTTGYVAGGSTVRFTGQEPSDVPSAALLGLDGSGKLIWAKRYTYGAAGAYSASGQVGLRLSDDGGVLASALVADPADPLGGRLWAFKPRAKDGSIEFTAGSATVTTLEVTDLPCSMTAKDLQAHVQPAAAAPRSVEVSSDPAQVTVLRQTER